jgi:uncharacterized protein involved in exopolysaccharide biosynthesis
MNNTVVLTWQDYWQILRRRRWLVILPIIICWCVVWALCWFLPAVYRSEALILIEQQKVPEHYVVSNVAADLQERLQSMTQQVLSRTRLRSIIGELHLYSAEGKRQSPDELVERMRKDIKIEMVETPNRPDELTAFRIAYSGSEPRLAQQVTSALSAFFIDENLRSREKQSEDTTDFLETQLQEARKHLEEQEAKLRVQRPASRGTSHPTEQQSPDLVGDAGPAPGGQRTPRKSGAAKGLFQLTFVPVPGFEHADPRW